MNNNISINVAIIFAGTLFFFEAILFQFKCLCYYIAFKFGNPSSTEINFILSLLVLVIFINILCI